MLTFEALGTVAITWCDWIEVTPTPLLSIDLGGFTVTDHEMQCYYESEIAMSIKGENVR